MNNLERAAGVIDRWTQDGSELNSAVGSTYEIAETLADAGLLMPDLPEPILIVDALGANGVAGKVAIYGYGAVVEAGQGGDILLHGDVIGNPKELALWLLAADKWRNQK